MDIERTSYIVIILLLAISASILLYAFLERSRNNRTLKRVEQIRSNIFTEITHEFRTPLTTILGLSKQLRDQKDLINNNVAETFLNAIERQSNYLSELVNQLLSECESNTVTCHFSVTPVLIKQFKDMWQIFFADPFAVVNNFYENLLIVFFA